jgi:hypothetical protein
VERHNLYYVSICSKLNYQTNFINKCNWPLVIFLLLFKKLLRHHLSIRFPLELNLNAAHIHHEIE